MDKKKVKNRLSRIEGQVRGISRMVDETRETSEIVNQLQAAKSAVASLIVSLVEEKFTTNESGLTISPDDAAMLLRLIKN